MILTDKYGRKWQIINGYYTLLAMLLVTVMFSQESIVASGTDCYTIGEIFPIMQSDIKQKEVSLSIPKYEIPIPEPKPSVIKKKKNFFQKLIEVLIKIFKK